jgi:sRNA-binding protein
LVKKNDPVNNPKHYTEHPSGVECIDVTEHMCFNLGNAMKYIWRCDLKADAIEDLEKTVWYVEREIAKRKTEVAKKIAKKAAKKAENKAWKAWKASKKASKKAAKKSSRKAANRHWKTMVEDLEFTYER